MASSAVVRVCLATFARRRASIVRRMNSVAPTTTNAVPAAIHALTEL